MVEHVEGIGHQPDIGMRCGGLQKRHTAQHVETPLSAIFLA
jgi:hypothetical protein